MIDAWVLERLVCPVTRTQLRYEPATSKLISEAAGLAYPVIQGTPTLLVDAARRLDLGQAAP